MNKIVVCDTNLLVSATIFPNSVPAKAYEKAISAFDLAVSNETLFELSEVLMRSKFDKYLSLTARQQFLKAYQERSFTILVTHSVSDCRDPKDNKFLDLALSCSATYIISGDPDLLVLHPYREINVVTPADFLK